MHGDCLRSAADLKMRAFCAPPKFEFGSCLDCVGGANGAIAVSRGPMGRLRSRVIVAD